MSARPSRARLQSLCGTARGLAHQKSATEPKKRPIGPKKHRPCRHSAIWACQGNGDRTRRLALR